MLKLHMKSLARFACLVALTAVALAALVPDALARDDGTHWVALDVVFRSPDSEPSWDLVGDDGGFRRFVDRARNHPPSLRDGCNLSQGATVVEWEDPKPNATLPELVANAQAIVLGDILEVEEGFFHGEFGSLVRLSVSASFVPRGGDLGREVGVFYPEARLEHDGVVVCKSGSRNDGESPEPGRRMLIFAYRVVPEFAADIIYPDDEEVFFELGDGSVSLPRIFSLSSESMDFDVLVERVRSGVELE